MDPLASQFPSWSDYNYVMGNPVMFIDPDGRAPESTHIDEYGNVIDVKNDGDLGVYQHSQTDIATGDLDKFNRVGSTLFQNSFKKGDKINLNSYRARDWINAFEGNREAEVGLLPSKLVRTALYSLNGGNGSLYDPKSYMEGGIGGGSQLSDGVYISNRDLGNFAAGAFARINGLDKKGFLQQAGAFAIAGNSLSEFSSDYRYYMNAAMNYKATDGAFQKTYGEDNKSNYFQRLGYENIRTMKDFNSNFKKTFYED